MADDAGSKNAGMLLGMIRPVRLEQFKNASSPMLVTKLETVTAPPEQVYSVRVITLPLVA